MNLRLASVVAAALSLFACSAPESSGTGAGIGGGDGGGTGGGDATDGGVGGRTAGVVDPNAFYDGGVGGMPCAVASMVAEKCVVCHGTPLAGNATFTLKSRADFLQPSLVDPEKNLFQQARIRLHNPYNPMPPAGYQQPTADEVYAFDHWEMAGAPEGTCNPMMPPPQPTSCASNKFWGYGNSGSSGMNPGLACRACHLGQNFNGQNPQGYSEPFRAYFFMGTVFSDAHAKNLCNTTPPSGAKIEILDKNGNVALTMTANSVGNFYSTSTTTSIPMPYTARVTANGMSAKMLTPQTSGDCNACHVQHAAAPNPGRIVAP